MTNREPAVNPTLVRARSRLQALRQMAETQPAEAVLTVVFQEYSAVLEELHRQNEELKATCQNLTTERQGLETALRESEVRDQRLVEMLPDAAGLVDLEGRVLLGNSRAAALLGYARAAELVGHRVLEFVAPDDQPRALADLQRLAETGNLCDVEYAIKRQDGTTWVGVLSVSVLHAAGGKPSASLWVLRDIAGREMAAVALDRERRLLRTVIDNLPDQIFARDRACHFTLSNRSDAQVMGVADPETLLGKRDEDFYPPELAARYQADDLQVMETGQPLLNREEPSIAPGGRQRWTLTTKVPLRDNQGEVVGLVGIARDITERKQAEAEIQRLNEDLERRVVERTAQLAAANEGLQREIAERQRAEALLDRERRLLRTVIDTLPDQIYAHDREGRFMLNNRSDARILGVADPEMLSGKNDRDFYPPEMAARFRADDRQVVESGQPLINREEPSLTPDGKPRWTLTTKVPWRDGQGQVIGLVGVSRDITERKQADLLIQSQREQLEAQNEALLARNQELIAQARTLAQTEAALRRLNTELEQRVAARTAELSARTQEISLANAALMRAARMKDDFLASMSHELRTPLTGILGLAELLQMGIYGPLTDQQLNSVRTLHESGEHLLALINDILDVAKIEAGIVELQMAPMRVVEVCETSLQFIQPQAQKKGLRLSFNHDLAVNVIRADARRLRQMLVNLLSNAVKFTPAGGAISLEVAGDAAQQQVQLTVADTGIGVAPEDRPRLFRPFVQLDSRLAREYEGTGLGLSLVKGLAELHGGSVQVESDGVPGRGSRFTITLPWSKEADRAPVQTDPATVSQPPAAHPVRRALIVEDAPEAAEQLARYLADLGIANVVHASGLGVIEKAVAAAPDVILLDMLLPGVSGWEVLTQLKADPRTLDLPVIMVSGVEAEREKAEALGVAGYLVKPVSLSDLQTALHRGTELAAARPRPAAPVVAAGETSPTGPVILLADDSEIVLSTLGDFLRSQAYQVVVARHGGEALEKARQLKPAVILMDIQMPVLDGLEAIRRLRAEAEAGLAATPVIALTALAMSGDLQRCLAAGANAYVPKPVNLETLVKVIKTCLEGHSSQRWRRTSGSGHSLL